MINVAPPLTSIANILSDGSRVSMVSALLDGRSLTAHELAHGAGITPQTASFHLRKLTDAGLVQIRTQGRHRFFRLTSQKLADAMRILMDLTPNTSVNPAARKQNAVCFARTCYGHLAGRLGVAITEAMEEKKIIRRGKEDDFDISQSGSGFLEKLGIDRVSLEKSRRRLASQCLDWSERHSHVGGALGYALAAEFVNRRWISTRPGVRALLVTPAGRKGLGNIFDIEIDEMERTFFEPSPV